MLLSFVGQCVVLGERGELRGQCPLGDAGEILVFLAWSMTLFYLVIGSTYRLSLLGVFTAPLVSMMLFFAMIPGMFDVVVVKPLVVDAWGESHAALSVMAYGALGLAAIAGVMFMILNHLLKAHSTKSELFQKLPPVSSIVTSVVRLLLAGTLILSGGIVCGFMMVGGGGGAHLWVAMGVWFSYAILLGVWFVRGMTPAKLSMASVFLFVISLLVFAVL